MTKEINGRGLAEAIQEAPEPRKIKPRLVGENDVSGMVHTLLNYHNRCVQKGFQTESIDRALFDGYYIERKGELFLKAVEPNTRIVSPSLDIDLGYLIHRGVLSSKGDNLTNILENGVFGNPNDKVPIYLSRDGARVTTWCNPYGRDGITLKVDKTELMKRRSIFLDPESLEKDESGYDLKEDYETAYIVFGGIPVDAIHSFDYQGERYELKFDNSGNRTFERRCK